MAAWLEANPAEQELVERLDAALTSDASSDVDVETALAHVHARMQNRTDIAQRPRLTVTSNRAPTAGGRSPRAGFWPRPPSPASCLPCANRRPSYRRSGVRHIHMPRV